MPVNATHEIENGQTAAVEPESMSKKTKHSPRGKDEWVIDESTRKLYLDLLADKKMERRRGSVKPAPRVVPLPKDQEPTAALEHSKTASAQVTIGLDEGAESTTRFLLYAVLIIGAAFLIYKAITWSGNSRPATNENRRTGTARLQAVRTSKANTIPNAVQAPASDSLVTMASVTEPSLTLIPTMILDGTQPNQSSTHTLVVHNRTPFEMAFAVEARDLVTQKGKPVYLNPGQAEGSVAATIVYSTRTLEVKPMQSASLEITLTMPDHTAVRGVAILLNSRSGMSQGEAGSLSASLGSFITWAGNGNPAGPPVQSDATGVPSGTNLAITQWVVDPPPACPGAEPAARADAVPGNSGGGAQ